MNGNFKVRCVCNNGHNQSYTNGKIYDVVDYTLFSDDNSSCVFTSFENLQKASIAEWELVKEIEINTFKARCLYNGGADYTKDKIYDISNGCLRNDNGQITISGITSFDDLNIQSNAGWEKVGSILYTTTKNHLITNEKDVVNQPSHYLSSSLECIQAMEMAFGIEVVYNFCICNAWKYLWRYKGKNGKQDVEKARWYIDKAKSYNHYEVQHINIENVLIEIEKEVK